MNEITWHESAIWFFIAQKLLFANQYDRKFHKISKFLFFSKNFKIIKLKKTKMNCELMLTYDTPALRQTGSRNLMGQKTLPTIWHTYMKLVTKYQIPVINSCLEKCDEKYAHTNVC